MFGRLCLAGALISTISCANPKYEKIVAPEGGGGISLQSVSQCEAKFKKLGLCVLWQWNEKPDSKKAGELTFKLVRANALDDSPVPVDTKFSPAVVLWMPSMGHGSSPTQVERVDVGSFRVTNVFFVMPGAWQIKFQLKDGDVIEDEVVIDVQI